MLSEVGRSELAINPAEEIFIHWTKKYAILNDFMNVDRKISRIPKTANSNLFHELFDISLRIVSENSMICTKEDKQHARQM